MRVSELKNKLPNELIEEATKRGINNLTPPQELAINFGLLDGKNFVVASPTASGKTFIAEMAILRTVLWQRKKAVYIAPMRALVSEKYEEFKEHYPYVKVAMSIGDLDSLDQWLEKYDIIFVSTEKFDSLIRHGISWLDSIGCVIFDEVHMLDDYSRGPTLEILISKLRKICKDAQLIALSATIGNAGEIAQWLHAELIESDYRPVKLRRGIELNGSVFYEDNEEPLTGSHKIPEIRITEDTLNKGKQLIIFYSTKRNCEVGAFRLAPITKKYLDEDTNATLKEVSDKVLHALSKPTYQCEKLSKFIENGVAFHHSGLVNDQRHAVENAFRENKIKVICSTTTLGLGVNLPAHTVVVRDTSRYSEFEGAEKMSINEVTQLFGRAGRPKYDTEGRALLISRSKGELNDLFQRYMNSELEPVISKLGVLPVLRTHILSFVATNFLRSSESILSFLNETFYGYHYANMEELREIVAEVLSELEAWNFVNKSGSIYSATKLGNRVSELYIDPLTAKWIIDTLPKVHDEMGILFMICNTIEMRPHVKATKRAEDSFNAYAGMLESQVYDNDDDMIYYDPLKPFSTAMMLKDWSEEISEQEIMDEYRSTPGALFTKISNADWLLYSSIELARIVHSSTTKLLETRVRVRYGIKKELLDLIRLEQVGRVRARLMYNAGIKKVYDLRKDENKALINRLFGPVIAEKILSQINSLND